MPALARYESLLYFFILTSSGSRLQESGVPIKNQQPKRAKRQWMVPPRSGENSNGLSVSQWRKRLAVEKAPMEIGRENERLLRNKNRVRKQTSAVRYGGYHPLNVKTKSNLQQSLMNELQ